MTVPFFQQVTGSFQRDALLGGFPLLRLFLAN